MMLFQAVAAAVLCVGGREDTEMEAWVDALFVINNNAQRIKKR